MFTVGARVSVSSRFWGGRGQQRAVRSSGQQGWRQGRVLGTVSGVAGKGLYLVRWDDTSLGESQVTRQSMRVEQPRNDASSSDSGEEQDAQSVSPSSDNSHDGDTQCSNYSEDPEVASEESAVSGVSVNIQSPPRVSGDLDPESEFCCGENTWTWQQNISIDAQQRHTSNMQVLNIDASQATPLELFLFLFPYSLDQEVENINRALETRRHRPKKITKGELLLWKAIFIGKALLPRGSQKSLWHPSRSRFWCSFNAGELMPLRRFETIKLAYEVVNIKTANTQDKWWRVRDFVNAFNSNRRQNISPSWIVVGDESMWPYTGTDMPHLSFVKRKPKALGCEVKNLADGVSGVMLFFEIQEGKSAMHQKPHYAELGATAACLKRMVKDSGISHTGRLVCADSWFASVKTARALLDIGTYFTGPVKTAHKNFPLQKLANKLSEEPRGAMCVATTSINSHQFIGVGWKRKSSRGQYYVSTAGVTADGKQAKVHFHDEFGNFSVAQISRPKMLESYSMASGKIDQHNKLRQHVLGLESCWKTSRYWFRILTSITGTAVVDAYLVKKHCCPTGSDVPLLDFVDELVNEMIDRGQQLLAEPTNQPNTSNQAQVCRPVSLGFSFKKRRVGVNGVGTEYKKYRQLRCVTCTKRTAFICEACNKAFCHKPPNDCMTAHIWRSATAAGSNGQEANAE